MIINFTLLIMPSHLVVSSSILLNYQQRVLMTPALMMPQEQPLKEKKKLEKQKIQQVSCHSLQFLSLLEPFNSYNLFLFRNYCCLGPHCGHRKFTDKRTTNVKKRCTPGRIYHCKGCNYALCGDCGNRMITGSEEKITA